MTALPKNVSSKARKRAGSIQQLATRAEVDQKHHLTGPFMPQTPFDSKSTTPSSSQPVSPLGKNRWNTDSQGFWHDVQTLRWAVVPSSAAKILAVPIILYMNWEILSPFVAPGMPNPFAPFLFIQYELEGSAPDDPKYGKGPMDLLFVAYSVVLFSFIRQVFTLKIFRPFARRFGIKKEAKLDRFGEQGYAVVYFTIAGFFDVLLMRQLPTWWFRTEHIWIDYPHWMMSQGMKRYYLMQVAYWIQQALVLILGLERPRKDYWELVGHHIVTLWMVIMSYFMNLTRIGNAVFLSMDIPDAFLAFSKLLNYMQYERAKVVSFAVFVPIWTYFRHWLNWVILYSVWFEWKLIPTHAQQLKPSEGFWLPIWVRPQAMLAISALQALNLFWYYLILRIIVRAIITSETTDVRSDDEDDGEDEHSKDE